MSEKIKQILAWEILDSRSRPTLAVKVILESNEEAEAYVPSGASTGQYEAVELRDNDMSRYNGKGLLKAIDNVENKIAKILIGKKVSSQKEIDQAMIELDASDNKKNLGANAILGVSLAVAKAAALHKKQRLYDYLLQFSPHLDGPYNLPLPMFNVLNGGQHANWASDIQEYMIIPVKAKSFSSAIKITCEIYQELKEILKEKNYSLGLGDEGGFSPSFKDNEEPFQLISKACQKAGYLLGEDIKLAIDAAASEFYKDGKYHLKKENKSLNSEELSKFYNDLMKKYPIVSLEDVFDENDWSAFIDFNKKNSVLKQIVGDDIYVTNINKLQRGIKEKASNSILIKLNQIGTLTETVEVIHLAYKNNLSYVISHRSGETEDSFIADFALAMGGGQIKTGAPARGERTAKYNRLLSIEKELGPKAKLAEFPFLGK